MQLHRKKHKGQTMVLFLGLVATTIAVMLVSFNSGETTNAKMRAMNAADAAAYSGAVWEARTLNFQAYLNRAVVANEIAIAQSVSLRSWISYLSRFVTNVNYVTEFIPYVGEVTTAIADGLSEIDQVMQETLPFAEKGLRYFNTFEYEAEVGINATGPAVAEDLALNVAQLNNAKLTPANAALAIQNETDWLAFTFSYHAGNQRSRFREVTLNSRDGFTNARDADPLLSFPLTFYIRKQGGTDLIDWDTWKGLDSAEMRFWDFTKWEWDDSGPPIGWGGAQAYYGGAKSAIGKHGNINQWDHTDGRWANQKSRQSPNASSIGARFQGGRDLSVNARNRKIIDRMPFAVEVQIDAANIQTSDVSMPGGDVALKDGSTIKPSPSYANGGSGKGVYALAESCVRFARPYHADRSDGAFEKPSLFSPYWTATLATESRNSRGIVDLAKGILPIAAVSDGVGSCRDKKL